MGTSTAYPTPRSRGSSGSGIADVARSYRLITFGDSRARAGSVTQIGNTGSGSTAEIARFGPWCAAMMGDCDIVADFSVGGDKLISSSASTGWNGQSRNNSKTFANLLALKPDAVLIQYGINDLPAASSDALIAAAKSMVSKLVASNIKVLLQNIMLFDPTAATPNISPANAAATLVKINAFRDAMTPWMATLAGRAVFVDPNTLIALPATGYGDPQYFSTADTLGVHPNKIASQLMGKQAADALRTLLPSRRARAFTAGPLSQPNLIDWGASAAANTTVSNSNAGTTTSSPVTWNMDADGTPYIETTITPTVLASGRALARVEVWATDIAGATPRHAIFAGDVLQGSARVVMDDGAGGVAALQCVNVRQRLYDNASASKFYADWGGVSNTDLTLLPMVVDGRFSTATCVCPIASATIGTPAAGLGYYLAVFVETTALAPIRVRIYAPSLRVVSRAQPVSVTAGTSPYSWTNNPQPFAANDWVNAAGRPVLLTVAPGAGGTISQIALTRGPSTAGTFTAPVNTGLTQGAFVLMPGDGVIVTWASTAAVLTYTALDE